MTHVDKNSNVRTPLSIRRLTIFLFAACAILFVTPTAYGLPSYARQTGQKCAACHVGGNWPQLTPWGRFFKLAGYTAGKSFIDREGFNYVPLGVLARAGLTFAAQSKNNDGQTVIQHSVRANRKVAPIIGAVGDGNKRTSQMGPALSRLKATAAPT